MNDRFSGIANEFEDNECEPQFGCYRLESSFDLVMNRVFVSDIEN